MSSLPLGLAVIQAIPFPVTEYPCFVFVLPLCGLTYGS